MKIRGLFHTPFDSLELVKNLNMTHAHLLLENGRGDEFYAKAHTLGLHCMISEGTEGKTIIEFLGGRNPCPDCFVTCPDEPNLRGISPQVVRAISNTFNAAGWETFVALSDIRSYSGYEGVASIIAFSQYEDWTLWRKLKMLVRLKLFRIKSKAKILAIIPVKPGKLARHYSTWKNLIRTDGYFFYSFVPNQESPPWASVDVSELPYVQEILRRINRD